MTRTPQNPAASTRAPVASHSAALRGGPAVSGSPPLAAGGKTPRPEGSPTPLQGVASTSPRDRVRAVAGTEAGAAVPREDAAPAGSTTGRTYTIALPAGLEMLSLNDRLHWRVRHARAQVIKDAACVMARKAGVPLLGRAGVVVEYQPPDRRHRDADNPVASAKAAIDGLVMAKCLADDECPRYVTGIYCTIGEIFPGGRLVLHVTEVAEIGGAA